MNSTYELKLVFKGDAVSRTGPIYESEEQAIEFAETLLGCDRSGRLEFINILEHKAPRVVHSIRK